MPFNVGPWELLIVLAIALIVLGPGKLPEVGSALGKTIREFRRASNDLDVTAPPRGEVSPALPAGAVEADTASESGPARS